MRSVGRLKNQNSGTDITHAAVNYLIKEGKIIHVFPEYNVIRICLS